MTARLTSAMLVAALVRRVNHEGGNAIVVARGDPTAGAILLDCLERGRRTGFCERVMRSDDRYGWSAVGPAADSAADEVDAWLARRRSRDPDLWIVELDIPNAQRFAAETMGDD